ncbi:VTT domain-containing protein [Desulfosoma caldarium]|uniref:Putative membrane protein YdjX (TVP38/TMEM64 family) n=1 Tax=Desulfosoma caldarium TaxID=610254 RepID=A0A3N1ULJ5_9BACT|nr:VTT domain-containing protein [Desulfosoma caldarium]ROQ92095.1 putative membrane protein YdjX (TVP38/TMEM64 family) [Desulfosoma caldarium]
MLKSKRFLLVVGMAILVVLFFTTGLHRQFTLESVKAHQGRLQDAYHEHPLRAVAAFSAVYIPVIALNLPGAVVLGLAAGAIFGTLAGILVVSFASSIGATLACLLSRYLLRDWVHRRFGDKLKRVDAGIQEEGAFYLFALRLMPIIPFFVINMVMGLTPMRLRTFYWVSQLGMLPGTAVFVNAGSQLGQIESPGQILSPRLLLSLALLGIFPLLTRRALNFCRNRLRKPTTVDPLPVQVGDDEGTSPKIEPYVRDIRERCTECGACVKQCAFLSHYGTPKAIAALNFNSPRHQAMAYECSLCGLCRAVCPEKLDPFELFLEIRRRYVTDGHFDASVYRPILNYEKIGISPAFSWYGLPEGCDTVFFPGCALPGTRPEVTVRLFQDLQKDIPTLGVVLDCCTKPSHDLGRQAYFDHVFGEMIGYLSNHGVRRVLVACPNCYKIFSHYGNGICVETVYEFIHTHGFRPTPHHNGLEVSVHDPCSLREEAATHQAVRGLLSDTGVKVVEMKHRGRRAICCGEGGMVGFVKPQWAQGWAEIRHREASGRTIVTYCAGCTGFLSRKGPAIHITDLLYQPERALNGKVKVARPPFTYLNRLLLKRRFKKELNAKTSRVRPRQRFGEHGS